MDSLLRIHVVRVGTIIGGSVNMELVALGENLSLTIHTSIL